MIDIRPISYTEGTPLSPVVKGVLLKTADPFPDIPKGGLISRVTTPKKSGGVLELISTLGVGGLARVYTSAGAYGSKEATKTVITEYIKGKGLPVEPLEELWKKKEFVEWQPKAILPIIGEIPSPQIDPKDPTGLIGWLPSFDDIKTPLLIAGGVVAAALFLPSIIGAIRKK